MNITKGTFVYPANRIEEADLLTLAAERAGFKVKQYLRNHSCVVSIDTGKGMATHFNKDHTKTVLKLEDMI